MEQTDRSFLMTSTLQTPFIYYTKVDDLNSQAEGALLAANGYFDEGNPVKTLEYYQKALAAQPHSSHLLSNVGAMLCAAGRVQEGIATLKKAVEESDPASAALYNLGTLLIAHGLYKDAQNLLERVAQKEQHALAIYNNLGVAYLSQHLMDKAMGAFDKAQEIDPQFDYTYVNKGLVAYEQNNLQDAEKWLTQALEKNESNFTTLNNLAVVTYLRDPNHVARAIELLKKAVELQPRFQMAYYNMGYLVATHNLV